MDTSLADKECGIAKGLTEYAVPDDIDQQFETGTANYIEVVRHCFISMLPPSVAPQAPETEVLNLATSVFRCEKDKSVGHHFPVLWFNNTGHHGYGWFGSALSDWPGETNPAYVFDQTASDVIASVLLASGLASDTTVQGLETHDPRVACVQCEEDGGPMGLTMGWRRAVCAECRPVSLVLILALYPLDTSLEGGAPCVQHISEVARSVFGGQVGFRAHSGDSCD